MFDGTPDIARCWARNGTFKKAASALKKAGLKDDWKSLKDDEAFAEMKKEGENTIFYDFIFKYHIFVRLKRKINPKLQNILEFLGAKM